MDCPHCGAALIVAERDGIELDCCPTCRGLWFDVGELDLLAEQLGLPRAEHDPAALALADVRERPRRCPRCDQPLEKVYFDRERTIVIDRCPRNHGLWFDRGELGRGFEQLTGLAGAAPRGVVSFLGETFRR